MKTKILIVEDQFVEANNLKIILKKAGYIVSGIARSVPEALILIDRETPDMVLLDIFLQGDLTGIDLAEILKERAIAFVFLSANSDKKVLDAAKVTKPYGFLVKPFREKDVLVMLDVAAYLHGESELTRNNRAGMAGEAIPDDAFRKIIGKSPAMLDALNHVRIVGPSNTSVLILGESGTGKELIAQCIHEISPRRLKPLIVINCGALPANLVESELFGHEKGSFTGANVKRIGKFEQADGGTVFLDEIGELSMDLQVKFLRVLQEREIEPIGGNKKKIDVRIIAATNRNLEDEVANGRFRLDLYYRLNIFPLTLPRLNERKEDIPLLASHFLNLYALQHNKIITGFSDQALRNLQTYGWPGNIRELENLMARTALLTTGNIVNSVQLPALKKSIAAEKDSNSLKSIAENERDHILDALIKTDWKISGVGGAAEILDINPTTLSSRIKKLGIDKMKYLRKIRG